MSVKLPSVAARIGHWLADNPDGGTQGVIIKAAVPEQSRQAVAAALTMMVRTRKATASGGRPRTYTSGPLAGVDRRLKHHRDTLIPPMRSPLLTQIFAADIKLPSGKPDVTADVAAFLKRGGRIEKLPMGASAAPLIGGGHAAVNEYTWRKAMQADIPN